MKKSKYTDVVAAMHVIGNIYRNPHILENEETYFFNEEDFTEDFHKVIFGTIYNLFQLGVKEISIVTIEDYLSERPNSLSIYKANKGVEWLNKISDNISLSTFDYYYGRLKKMSLLRCYDEIGMDVSWLYDTDILFDTAKKQAQEDWLDSTSLEDIANLIDDKIVEIRMKCVENSSTIGVQAGENIDNLIDDLMANPEVGYPLYGKFINTITRGARLKKFYLRSAATGVGKTRAMVADACYIACNEYYNLETRTWEDIGIQEPCLYIATEQDLGEMQTMMLAFLSGVEEDHILNGKYEDGELDRVRKAAQILKNSPIYCEFLPDFSLKDIENVIRKNIRENNVKYVFYDYIHTSMKILEEITKRSGGVRLREDNVLFMLSVRLKDLCNQFSIFIESSTQLNGDFKDAKVPDQTLLRGAKAIADKIDYGSILMDVTSEDLEFLKPLIDQGFGIPTAKLSIYKNRRGKYKGLILWMDAKKGICRFDGLYATDYNYEFKPIENTVVKIKQEKPKGAF